MKIPQAKSVFYKADNILEVKGMTTKQKTKTKKIVDIVVNVILWIFVALCVFVTIVAVSASSNAKNVPTIGGKCYLSVLSESMNADKPEGVPADKPKGFKQGSLIVGKYISSDDSAIDALSIGDIVTFEWDINKNGTIEKGEYNTHRIVKIDRDSSGKVTSVTTQGDNRQMAIGTEVVSRGALIAVYTGKEIGGIGGVLSFLSSRLGFGLCILLPLAAFFIYQLVVFIRTVISVKNDGKKMITQADEELIKQRAIEEYLRKQEENKKTDN